MRPLPPPGGGRRAGNFRSATLLITATPVAEGLEHRFISPTPASRGRHPGLQVSHMDSSSPEPSSPWADRDCLKPSVALIRISCYSLTIRAAIRQQHQRCGLSCRQSSIPRSSDWTKSTGISAVCASGEDLPSENACQFAAGIPGALAIVQGRLP